MESCFLFGNGINRCCGATSWDVLLRNIAEKFFISTDYYNYSSLAFEQIMCSALRSTNKDINSFAFEEISKLDKFDSSSIYRYFFEDSIKTILTTNYDYSIERTILPSFRYGDTSDSYSTKNKQEKRVSCGRYTEICGKKVFHIHGELGLKNTICLGHIHYAENIARIIKKITISDDDSDGCTELISELFDGHGVISWAQYFFTNDMHIVGLSLSPSEIDLWWLIAYRAQLLLRKEERIKNTIRYYYLYENERNREFVDCLKDFKVDVRELKVTNNDWTASYLKIAEYIKEDQ